MDKSTCSRNWERSCNIVLEESMGILSQIWGTDVAGST